MTSPAPEYVAGAVVKSTGRFHDWTGAPADPSTITAAITYGTGAIEAPVAGVVVRVSAGVYTCDVATIGAAIPTEGEVPVVVTWIGTGNGVWPAPIIDSFLIVPSSSSAADSVGP